MSRPFNVWLVDHQLPVTTRFEPLFAHVFCKEVFVTVLFLEQKKTTLQYC